MLWKIRCAIRLQWRNRIALKESQTTTAAQFAQTGYAAPLVGFVYFRHEIRPAIDGAVQQPLFVR